MKKPRRKSRHRGKAPHPGGGLESQSIGESTAVAASALSAGEPHANVAAPRSWRDRLFEPIDVASIAVFRIGFGLLLLYDFYKFQVGGVVKGLYVDPPFHFAFFSFDFIRPLPGNGMYLLFAALTVCAVLITVGLFYRFAMTVFFLGWSYIFLIEEARYLNHFYFIGLLAFLMIFVPAARGWSLDALIVGRSQDARIPAWSLWILRVQMEIMLIFAGIVKLTPDWLQGEPLAIWLAKKSGLPIVGPLLLNDTIILMGAWGAAFLHLIGAVMLLFKSTRLYAFIAYCMFHLANSIFFPIGIFPWLTIAGTLLFFDPDWPKSVWRKFAKLFRLPPSLQPTLSSSAPERPWSLPSPATRTTIMSLIMAWTAFQVLLPSRHWLYPGHTGWHEQGSYFAWQMRLRQKVALARVYVRDPDTNREWIVDPRRYLTPMQAHFVAKRPELMRQFAHYLEKVWAKRYGTRDIEVRAFTAVSLNGRRAQALIDPTRDLTKIGYTFGNSDWILPLKEPMPSKAERWITYRHKVLLRNMKADPAMQRLLAKRELSKSSSRQSE
jgi:hypothetical protein